MPPRLRLVPQPAATTHGARFAVAGPTMLAPPKNQSGRDVRLALELRELANRERSVAARRFINQLADALLIRAVIPSTWPEDNR